MRILQNQLTSVGRLRIAIRFDAMSAKEAFQVGLFQPSGLTLPLLAGAPSLPFHFSPDIHMFYQQSTGAAQAFPCELQAGNKSNSMHKIMQKASWVTQ
jgi:hypothetical protein